MKKLITLILILCSSMSLSGCIAGQISPEIAKDISKGMSNVVKNSIENNNNNISAEKTTLHNLGTDDSVIGLKVNSCVGEITTEFHDLKEVLVNATVKVRSKTKERAEQIIDEFVYTVEINGKTINIDTTAFYDGLNNSVDGVSVDLDIKVPTSVTDFNIELGVGEVSIQNVKGYIKCKVNVGDIDIKNSVSSYDLTSNVGNVTLNECEFTDSSKFLSDVGDVDISAKNISDAKDITIKSNVGDINMSLPQNSNYTADINEFLKDQRSTTSGNGKTKISLTTDLGNINFK